MSNYVGGCTCGAIRYEAAAEPILMLNCHCRDCQRASGSAYAAIAVFPKGAVKLEGAPRYHTRVGDSGNKVERGFCPACGSPVCALLEHLPDVMGVSAASLDDPSRFQPAMDIFTTSAHAWDHMDPDLPKKPRGVRS